MEKLQKEQNNVSCKYDKNPMIFKNFMEKIKEEKEKMHATSLKLMI